MIDEHTISDTEARLALINEWEEHRAKAIEHLKRKNQKAYRSAKTKAANKKIRQEKQARKRAEIEKIRQERLDELIKLFKEKVLTSIQEGCKAPEQRKKAEKYVTRLFSSVGNINYGRSIESGLNHVLDTSENGSIKYNIPPSKYSGYGLNERKKDIINRRWLLKQTYREIGAAWKISGNRVTQLERQALNTIYHRVVVKIIGDVWVMDNQPPWLERLKKLR
jgi:DNA-directed RNA polymerase specialized sigma subunit